jgi:hypothetical protein
MLLAHSQVRTQAASHFDPECSRCPNGARQPKRAGREARTSFPLSGRGSRSCAIWCDTGVARGISKHNRIHLSAHVGGHNTVFYTAICIPRQHDSRIQSRRARKVSVELFGPRGDRAQIPIPFSSSSEISRNETTLTLVFVTRHSVCDIYLVLTSAHSCMSD